MCSCAAAAGIQGRCCRAGLRARFVVSAVCRRGRVCGVKSGRESVGEVLGLLGLGGLGIGLDTVGGAGVLGSVGDARAAWDMGRAWTRGGTRRLSRLALSTPRTAAPTVCGWRACGDSEARPPLTLAPPTRQVQSAPLPSPLAGSPSTPSSRFPLWRVWTGDELVFGRAGARRSQVQGGRSGSCQRARPLSVCK